MPRMSAEKAIEHAVKAHKNGELKVAEHYYNAILRQDPDNHLVLYNMGLLAKQVGKLELAIGFFKDALSKEKKFLICWQQLIKTLSSLQKVDEVEEYLLQAKRAGLNEVDYETLEETAAADRSPVKHDVHDTEPTMQVLNDLLEIYKSKNFDATIEMVEQLNRQFPTSKNLKNIHAATQLELGNIDEAKALYTEIVKLDSLYPDAYYNLAICLERLGEVQGAIEHYKKALEINDENYEALNNLGNIYKNKKAYDAALQCYQRAVLVNNKYAKAFNNLGNTFQKLGNRTAALSNYIKAIELDEGFVDPLYNLSYSLKNTIFLKPEPNIEKILLHILNCNNITRPSDVIFSCISLIKLRTEINNALTIFRKDTLSQSLNLVLTSISSNSLLLKLLSVAPIPDIELENLFIEIRFLILKNIVEEAFQDSFIPFQQALAMQCFINEYSYRITNEERKLYDNLRRKVEANIARGIMPNISEVLCLASYEKLSSFSWVRHFANENKIADVFRLQVQEPSIELRIRNYIPSPKSLSNTVSKDVREQYEVNPYPRWTSLRLNPRPKSIHDISTDLDWKLCHNSILSVKSPKILIAGCGTGRHAIETSVRFANAQIVALDLSLSSLSYAERKTKELNINNIEYYQCDILDVDSIEGEFDIIESVGVLHHMEKPRQGWGKLTKKLKVGGLMKIGLYSSLARMHITKIRENFMIDQRNFTEDELRQLRHEMKSSTSGLYQKLHGSLDFYSLSEFRDLIFHVQEHCFSLDDIKETLMSMNLDFCGFEGNFPNLEELEQEMSDDDKHDLDFWHAYEQRNPDLFAGMYQFWCQKRK